MKKYISCIVMLLAAISLCSAQTKDPTEKGTNEKKLKKWTVETSISTRYFGSDVSLWSDNNKEQVSLSPDKKHFFFVTHRGDLEKDRNIYKLEVFSAEKVMEVLNNSGKSNIDVKPIKTLTLSSETSYPAIENPVWLDSGKSILFCGVKEKLPQLYKFDIGTGSLVQLTKIRHKTKHPIGIRIVAKNSDGTSIFFAVDEYIESKNFKSFSFSKYPMFDVTNMRLDSLMGNTMITSSRYMYRGNKLTQMPIALPSLSLSPDGSKYVYVLRAESNVPSEWLDYYTNYKANVDGFYDAQSNKFNKVMVRNLDNNKISHFAVTPLGPLKQILGEYIGNRDPLWSLDSKYVILFNSAPPYEANSIERDSMTYIVAVNVSNGNAQKLAPMVIQDGNEIKNVTKMRWNKDGTELLITYADEKNSSTIGYTKKSDKWVKDLSPIMEDTKKEADDEFSNSLEVFVREDANKPPMVVASNGKREIYLTEPDPALQNVYMEPVKSVEWKEPDGEINKGLLTLPLNYEKLKPLPLVIQAYYSLPNNFRPDGIISSSYAMQLLAAQGYAVLQLDILDGGPNEGPGFVKRIDAAVKMLTDSGLVDPQKVGLVGFSRAGYQTLYAITHPGKVKLVAAIGSDSYTGSFLSYIISGGYGADNYKGEFWQNKEEWLKQETSFNINNVTTPFLYTFHNNIQGEEDIRRRLYYLLDLYKGFQINKRPLEFLIFPDGHHGLMRPKERLVSLGATVDWMNFWIKGIEDPDPAKAEKYARWHELRKMQDSIIKEKGEEKK